MNVSPSPALPTAQLYAILDLGYTAESAAITTTQALLDGGAHLLQLRAKSSDLEQIRRVALAILPLCRAAGVPMILNDFPDLAAEIDADGVHIGQDDGSFAAAQAIVGPHKIIGRSTHSLAQAQAALAEGFHYIGFGPIFPTPTKQGRPGIGMNEITAMQQSVACHIPAFCIGGIRRDNLNTVMNHGATRVVIVSDLLTAQDITAATREVVNQLATHR